MEFQLAIILKMGIACFLTGLVGLEREVRRKPAGLRTHMLVGGAAALLLSMGEILVQQFNEFPENSFMQTDPIRIIEAIIVGISFIGAGTILQSKQDERVKYLTTSASILFCAGIGIAVALNQYYLAAGATFLVLFINIAISFVEEKFIHRKLED